MNAQIQPQDSVYGICGGQNGSVSYFTQFCLPGIPLMPHAFPPSRADTVDLPEAAVPKDSASAILVLQFRLWDVWPCECQ